MGLHRARREAHRAFDQLWQRLGMNRSAAYQWLADRLGIPKGECHMARFDAGTCEKVVRLCEGFQRLPNTYRQRAA